MPERRTRRPVLGRTRTPAQWYLLVSGVVVVVIGVAGLGVDNSYDLALHAAHDPTEHQRTVFGVFATNGWHNAAALASGTAALALSGTVHAKQAARHLGAAYAVLTLAVAAHVPLPLLTDAWGNLVHLALAVGGLAAAALTSPGAAAPSGRQRTR